jgi:hypothetical protein
MVVADQRTGKILQPLIDPPHHDLGDGAHDETGRILGRRMILGKRHVEHALGLGVHFASEVEAREIEARRHALAGRCVRRCGDQLLLARAELGFPVGAPGMGVEHDRTIAARADLIGSRQDQAGRTRDHDLVAGVDIVGERLDHDAMGRRKNVEFEEILLLEKPARRRKAGHDEQRVADIGIDHATHRLRLFEGDSRARVRPRTARNGERQRRIEHDVADRNRPVVVCRAEGGEPRPLELDPHELKIGSAADAHAADRQGRIVLQRGGIDRGRGIEYRPQRVGTAEYGPRGGSLEREDELEVVVLPFCRSKRTFTGAAESAAAGLVAVAASATACGGWAGWGCTRSEGAGGPRGNWGVGGSSFAMVRPALSAAAAGLGAVRLAASISFAGSNVMLGGATSSAIAAGRAAAAAGGAPPLAASFPAITARPRGGIVMALRARGELGLPQQRRRGRRHAPAPHRHAGRPDPWGPHL